MSEEAAAVLEEGASPELTAEFEAFNKEQAEEAPVEEVKAEDTPVEEGVKTEEVKTEEESSDPFKFTVKGEEKTFTKDQLNNMLNREQTFQKKNNELQGSDEYKMGLLFSAAKGGDVGAQKKVKEMLSEVADLDQLDSVEESYNVEEKHQETLNKAAEEEPFADVKDDVDFQETLDRMQENFRERMPSNIYKDYLADPTSKKVMYDLEKSGRADELFTAFEEEISELSSLDRAKINSDSTLYGNLFVEVLKSQNAKQGAKQDKVEEESNLDAVSSGNSSHSVVTNDSAPDWANMSKEEFAKAEAKALKASGY